MAVTENLHTGNGSKTNYAFTFPYLKTTDIKVSVNGTVVTNFTAGSPTATEIQFNTAPANNDAIRIYRDTATDNLSATFYAGSAIKSEDLNDNFLQNLYVTQEAKRDADAAWQDGDETISSTETWVSNNNRVATTGAIDARVDTKIDTALTTDVSGGDGVTIVDNNPGTGQIRVDLDADIATLKDMQSGAATQLAALTSTELAILDGATVSTDELNLLDGVTATTAELNYVDGVTSNVQTQLNAKQPLDAELTELATMGSTTASALADLTEAEVQILDGATVTTAELNKLDGVTATTAEINTLDGVTATTAELNILDGVTATTTELNILDGVTATTNELNKTDGLTSTPVELNILDGATANTSEINKLDGVTASTAELNIVAGKTFKTSSGTLTTTSDTEIPSSKVIAAHVASSITAVGGFKSIADEVSFPPTASQPATGVVVSINNAAGVVINGSGVSTTGRTTDGTPATITINGFPSSLYGETLAAGVGLLVTSTSTANTYTYHKLLASETDVKQLSDDINDFNSRYRIASSAPGSNNDEGDLYFDTAANKMKVYNGSAWDDVASVGSFYINTLSSSSGTGGGSATFNGSAYRFTLSQPASGGAQQLIVSVNGVIQKPNAGTSQPSEGFAVDGNDIIFSTAPASGSDFFIVTQGSSVSIGTPSANSVNSSHIIDGSIVNGDISSTADIALSKLNTTGTASNSNYLRGDGAWTDFSGQFAAVGGGIQAGSWSWQEGANNIYFKLNPSGDGSVELKHGADFNIDDNSKIQIGTGDDLQIYHDGTNSYVSQVTAGQNLFLKGDAVQIRSASNEQIIETAANGAVQLFYDNSKKLETTTTGINVTGAINVNGTALSAAPEITATASGTIAANAAVNLKSDGKVQAVAAVTAGATENLLGATEPNEEWHRSRWTYDTEQKKIIFWWRDEASGDFECKVGTPSGSASTASISWSSVIDTGFDCSNFNAYFDPQSKRHVILYHSSTNIKGRAIQLNSNGTLTVGSEYSIAGSADSGNKRVTMARAYTTGGQTATREIFYSYHYSSGTRRPYFGFFKVNSDNTISNINSGNQLGSQTSSSWGDFNSAWDHNNEVSVHLMTKASDDKLYMNWHRSKYDDQKGSTLVHSSAWGGTVIPIDESNALGICYRDGSDSGKLKLKLGTFSTSSGDEAATISLSSAYELTPTEGRVGSSEGSWVARDTETGRYYFAYKLDADGKSYLKYFTVDASNSVTVQSGNGVLLKDNDIFKGINMMFALDLKQMMVGCVIDTGTNDYEAVTYIAYDDTTSATNGNFIGFSSAGYSDGDTATIKVVGNTTTQSSLTPAQKYYVQHNGSLSTTPANPSIEAGIALSSTKLLIKG